MKGEKRRTKKGSALTDIKVLVRFRGSIVSAASKHVMHNRKVHHISCPRQCEADHRRPSHNLLFEVSWKMGENIRRINHDSLDLDS